MDTTAYRFSWRSIGLALLVAMLLLAISACTSLARQQLYLPGDEAPAMPEWVGVVPEEVTVTTEDNLTLPGLYWAPEAGQRDIVLVLHGRRDNYARMAGYVQRLAQDGRGVLVASYRGFSGNPGSPSEAGLIRDAQAFYRLARQRAGTEGSVYVFGHSLGGGVAFQLAAREQLDGVITLGTFTDVDEVSPFYADPFIPDPWDSLAALENVDEPLILIHGANDTYVTPAQSRTLYSRTCSDATLAVIEGVRHKPNFRLIQPLITGWIDALEGPGVTNMAAPAQVDWEQKARCRTANLP